MHLFSKSMVPSILAAAVALCAAAPLAAQATPLGAGGGAYVGQTVPLIHLTFSCVQLPDGSINGHAVSSAPGTQSFLHIDLSSATHVGGMLAVAGVITAAVNTPPHLAVGTTWFMVVGDSGPGSREPDVIATGSVPPGFGNPTIQQILALIGPPPPQVFSPLVSGNFKVM